MPDSGADQDRTGLLTGMQHNEERIGCYRISLAGLSSTFDHRFRTKTNFDLRLWGYRYWSLLKSEDLGRNQCNYLAVGISPLEGQLICSPPINKQIRLSTQQQIMLFLYLMCHLLHTQSHDSFVSLKKYLPFYHSNIIMFQR